MKKNTHKLGTKAPNMYNRVDLIDIPDLRACNATTMRAYLACDGFAPDRNNLHALRDDVQCLGNVNHEVIAEVLDPLLAPEVRKPKVQ